MLFESSIFSWEGFYTALVGLCSAFSHFINYMLFWVGSNVLKSIAFSTFILVFIQICSNYYKVGWKRTVGLSYLIYCAVAFFPPEIAMLESMNWWEMVIFLPYVIFIFGGGLFKLTSWGRKLFSFYPVFSIYAIFSIVWLLFVPTDGIWWVALIYFLILFVAGHWIWIENQ